MIRLARRNHFQQKYIVYDYLCYHLFPFFSLLYNIILYDAIYNSLVYFMERKLKDPSSFDSCIFYVATDGLENSSKITSEKLKEMVTAAAKPIYNINILHCYKILA